MPARPDPDLISPAFRAGSRPGPRRDRATAGPRTGATIRLRPLRTNPSAPPLSAECHSGGNWPMGPEDSWGVEEFAAVEECVTQVLHRAAPRGRRSEEHTSELQ